MNEVTLMILIFLVLLFLSMPVGFACLVGIIVYFFSAGLDLQSLAQYLANNMTSYTFLAIPFFVLMGELMNRSKVTDQLILFVKAFIGHIAGGLGYVNVVTSMLLAGMSGAATSDAAMTSNLLVPAMTKEGYDLPFSAAVTASSSTIGPIIPPSIGMVLIASINGFSVGKLFVGGVIPGLIMGISQMLIVFIRAKERSYPKSTKTSFSQKKYLLIKNFPALLTPIIVLGGLLSGYFTATEASVVGVIYVFMLGLFYRSLSFKDVVSALYTTVRISSATLFIVGVSSVFAWALTMNRTIHILTSSLTQFIESPLLFIVMINLLLIFLGCFVSTTAIIVVVSPILFPIALSYGIDPVHFGLIMMLNLQLGVLTPPVGIITYIVCGITKVDFKAYMIDILPFLFTIVITVLLVSFFPKFILWLPNLFFE